MAMPKEKHLLFRKLSKAFAEGFLLKFTEETVTQELLEWLQAHRYLWVFDLVLGNPTDLKTLKRNKGVSVINWKMGEPMAFSIVLR